jgi:hypothetical protein
MTRALHAAIVVWVFSLTLPIKGFAAPGPTEPANTTADASTPKTPLVTDTLTTLANFVNLRSALLQDIKAASRQIGAAQSESEKQNLKAQLDNLESDLRTITRNFENIAAGVDITSLRKEQAEDFNLQREIFALLKPALDEMREMTSHVRQKSELRDKITQYEDQLLVIERALANVDRLLAQSGDDSVTQALKIAADTWRKQQKFLQSELQASRLELEKLVASELSITEASQGYLKSFFQQRGLYLTIALLVVLVVIIFSRLSRAALYRYMPGFRAVHRSFRIRLLELIHRMITVFLVVIGPTIVFYIVEDWVLFSLSILLLFGIVWTLRQTLPRHLHQIQIFLNIGSVREGERLYLDGLPWLVKQINVFSTLINPLADLTQRVPINDLVDLKSRPFRPEEPWFPCRKGDWVMLGDGVSGKVIGISPELVQLVERGGAQRTYKTSDFLASSLQNLTTNFRLTENLGISYRHQKDSTVVIPNRLKEYIRRRVEEEGHAELLVNLNVEFAVANNSSLDLAVLADFKGEAGNLYPKLRRAIQRWCVEACTEYGWEIPFPQVTLSGVLATRDQAV